MSRRKKRNAGPAGIILGLVLSCAAAGGALFGLNAYGNARPAPERMDAAAQPKSTVAALWHDGDAYEAELPAAAQELPGEEATAGAEDSSVIYKEDGLTVSQVIGKRWSGYVAVLDDPSRLQVGTCPYFSAAAYGKEVKDMAAEAGALLAVNGGGFSDPGGDGKGGLPTGNVFVNGNMLWGERSDTVGIDKNGKMFVGTYSSYELTDMNADWALSYGPTLIKDGKVQKLYYSYSEPRTAIGQRADGSIVILMLQGRQASALGVTLKNLAQIMADYGCVNAHNLDGGASSDIWFKGEYLNVSGCYGGPRPIPTCLMVMPAGSKEAVQ